MSGPELKRLSNFPFVDTIKEMAVMNEKSGAQPALCSQLLPHMFNTFATTRRA